MRTRERRRFEGAEALGLLLAEMALATAQVTFGPQLATAGARVEVVPESVLLTFVGERRSRSARSRRASR